MSQTEIRQDVLDPIIRKNYKWLCESEMAVKTDDDTVRAMGAAFMSLVDYAKETGNVIDPEKDDMLPYAKAAAKTLAGILPGKDSMEWEEIFLREVDRY